MFDGRHVYFAPLHNGDGHGEAMRYDTKAGVGFTDASAWEAYDYGAEFQPPRDPDGYRGALFDGRYVYFVRFNNGVGYHVEILPFEPEVPCLSVNRLKAACKPRDGRFRIR